MSATSARALKTSAWNASVIVCALGYFVDIYDLLLFGIVRVPSLKAIGVPAENLLSEGVFLLNMQMGGMLVGGLLWGILGDKRGRVSVLFGSILLYSICNILNAFVSTVSVYGGLRFLAGVGLAGELGAAITLVSETMTKETRGIGTTIVASVGICGAIVAALVGDLFDWKTAYIIGGVLGLLLLAARFAMFESGMFESVKTHNHVRGDLRILLSNGERARRYLGCILIGVPIWFVIGILVTFAPELAKALHVEGEILGSRSIMFCYMGLALGDLASGLLSQFLRNRKKVVMLFLAFTTLLIAIYGSVEGWSGASFYGLCTGLGFGVGYWAVFVTIASEQFGTNIRATATTTVPNFVRGSVVPVTLTFRAFQNSLGTVKSAMMVGGLTIFLAVLGLIFLKETFGKDLNYIEAGPH